MTMMRLVLVGAVAGLGLGGSAWGENGGLAPVQLNQPLMMQALLTHVEGKPIFVEDVLHPVEAELQRLAGAARTLSEFRAAAREVVGKQINLLISDQLVYKAAKDMLQDTDNERLELYLNKYTKDLLSQYGGSQAKADQALRAKGSSFEREIAERRRKSVIDLFLHRSLWPKISVTRQDIMREYQRSLKKYTLETEIDLYTITLPVSRYFPKDSSTGKVLSNPTAAQVQEATRMTVERAKELLAEIKKENTTETFARLAEDNSRDVRRNDGGRWPRTKQGTLTSEAIEKVAFGLPANSVAEPLVVEKPDPHQSQVVIIKVGEVTPGRVVPFSEAQSEVERRLRETQYVMLTNDYFNKLRQKAAIESVEQMVETATEAAIARYAVK